mmetsp:Transcript_38740/g.111254  ORF Transcript_38740/g.111254 Transcript_38740/m.111254 type:complete len:209 (+) Transcript_38740:338-964(+)
MVRLLARGHRAAQVPGQGPPGDRRRGLARPGASLDEARLAGPHYQPLQRCVLGAARSGGVHVQAPATREAGGPEGLRGPRRHGLLRSQGRHVPGLRARCAAPHQAHGLQCRAAHGHCGARPLRLLRLPRDLLLRARQQIGHPRGAEGDGGCGPRARHPGLGRPRACARLLEHPRRHRSDGRHRPLLHARRPEGTPLRVGLQDLPLHQA